jgi:ubiquitin-protein ligase
MSNLSAASLHVTEKRIGAEIKKMNENRDPSYQIIQDEKHKFTFYFMFCGDPTSSYNNGRYIAKIMLPNDYPQNPGDFYMLTPSGRFNVDRKICLTISAYHKDSWSAIWSINKMVIAFMSIFNSDDTHGISHIKETDHERKIKAHDSLNYNLKHHRDICMKFTQFIDPDGMLYTKEEILSNIQSTKKVKKPKKIKKVEPENTDNKQILDPENTENKQMLEPENTENKQMLGMENTENKEPEPIIAEHIQQILDKIPQNYEEWKIHMKHTTINTYNEQLFRMYF